MIILLTLLSLCATECRVHRVPNAYEGCTFNLAGPAVCQDPSHWLPCVVVEKCDTVYDWHFAIKFPEYKNWAYGEYDATWIDSNVTRHYNWTAGLIGYSILCHPDTLVDSGVSDDDWWFSALDGKVEIRKPVEDDTLWIFDIPFLRSEMPDLKAMLREWRVEKCVKVSKFMMPDPPDIDWQIDEWWAEYNRKSQAVRDSCRCAVEGAKK